MLSLDSTIELDFKKFLRWWRRELDFLVPEKLRQLVSEKQGFIVVRPEGGKLVLTYRPGISNSGWRELAKLERGEAGIEQYQALLTKDEKLAKAEPILRLTANEAIQKELTLPAAAKENLQQVVAYELDRYTPFKADQVYFAVQPVEGEHEPGQIRVMLVLTPKEVLDALYQDLNAMGMSPLFVDFEGWPNDLEQRYDSYNLLPEPLRSKTSNTPKLIYGGLAAAAVLLLFATMALPVWFESRTVVLLQRKIDAIEKEAKHVKAQQLDIDAIVEETRKLIAKKNSAPMMLDMLNTLSQLLKDNTWVSYLQYADGHLQIQGESPAASTLLGTLEDSDRFNNARFISPVMLDKISGLERFQITVDASSPAATQGGSNGQAR